MKKFEDCESNSLISYWATFLGFVQILWKAAGSHFPFNSVLRISLTLVAMALFFRIMSLPQVTLNLVAEVTWNLTMRQHTPSPLPPPQLLQGPRHSLYWHNKFQYFLCCLSSWQLVIEDIFTLFDKLKKTFKFWAIGCRVKGPLPAPGQNWEALT